MRSAGQDVSTKEVFVRYKSVTDKDLCGQSLLAMDLQCYVNAYVNYYQFMYFAVAKLAMSLHHTKNYNCPLKFVLSCHSSTVLPKLSPLHVFCQLWWKLVAILSGHTTNHTILFGLKVWINHLAYCHWIVLPFLPIVVTLKVRQT